MIDPSLCLAILASERVRVHSIKNFNDAKLAHWKVCFVTQRPFKLRPRRNQVYSYYFCLMMEGSASGSIPLSNESGSRRSKNMWIRWIRIRIRNTVRNTVMRISLGTVAKSKIVSLERAVAVSGSLNESLGVDRTNRLSESLNISISAQVIHTLSGKSGSGSYFSGSGSGTFKSLKLTK